MTINMCLFQGVTPEVFLNVLQGAKDKLNGIGSGKVINRYDNYSLQGLVS